MFALQSNITIGEYTFKSLTDCNVKRSIHTVIDTAVIKVPVTAVIKQAGRLKTKVETAQQFSIGDYVEIKLGYNGNLNTEFAGFVKKINYTVPLEIECEDYSYLFREIGIKKSYLTTTLKAVLADIIEGINTITIHPDCSDINIKNLVLATESGHEINRLAALEKLRDAYGIAVYFDFNGRLYAGMQHKIQSGVVKYKLRYNTIDEDELKYHTADEVFFQVKAVHIDQAGNEKSAIAGEDSFAKLTKKGKKTNKSFFYDEDKLRDLNATTKVIYFYDVSDKPKLQELADQELLKYKFDGYEGKFKTFLVPYAQPTMVANIIDPVYNDRDDNYYIEGTEVEFGQDGARRIIQIGVKV